MQVFEDRRGVLPLVPTLCFVSIAVSSLCVNTQLETGNTTSVSLSAPSRLGAANGRKLAEPYAARS